LSGRQRDGKGGDVFVEPHTYMSDDFREGIEAFFAKRPAKWKGR
jgi:hypothetical protein